MHQGKMIGREEKYGTGREYSRFKKNLQEKYCTIGENFLLGENTAEGKIFLRSKCKSTCKYIRGTLWNQ